MPKYVGISIFKEIGSNVVKSGVGSAMRSKVFAENTQKYTTLKARELKTCGKELYAKCPGIRKTEERLGYNATKVTIEQAYNKNPTIRVDSFMIEFEKAEMRNYKSHCNVKMTNEWTGKSVKKLVPLDHELAAEQWIRYTFNRPSTVIYDLGVDIRLGFSIFGCRHCILNLDIPMTIINLILTKGFTQGLCLKATVPVKRLKINNLFGDDIIKTARSITVTHYNHTGFEHLLGLQANQIYLSNVPFSFDELTTYCRSISGHRPIGFRCQSVMGRNIDLNLLAERLNARETFLHERKCFTISIDDTSELNVSNLYDALVIEVNAKGTAIDPE
uniref:DUF1758 domain-containing protein n=1 Tax=Caenorhabditis tropicalis TaxID=1561998 RepID=A0A1I7V162_9PELO